MTASTLFSDFELTTRQMFETYRETRGSAEISSAEICVMNVFRAMAHAALPKAKVELIADAMHSMTGVDLGDALTRMVRAKVLRSYVSGGQRLYEVNF